MRFGRPHRHFRRTDSTNERAKELATAGAPCGLAVTADEQTAGRGRRGHAWFAPPGSCLLYSGLLRPYAGAEQPLLPLAVPIAVCEAAEAVAPVRCQVKWPNDVWIEERKVAGVLVEARPDEGWAVIGVESGAKADYGHMDLVMGDRAKDEVWPKVLAFFDRHATPSSK